MRGLCGCLFIVCLAGCGEAARMQKSASGEALDAAQDAAHDAARAAAAPAKKAAAPAPAAAGEAKLQRQIVYRAEVWLDVDDLTPISKQVEQLAKTYGGFVADSRLNAYSGSSRSASWKLRVPAANFEAFLSALRSHGELRTQTIQSDDVSEEYYDVSARIRNREKEEKRLLTLLDEQTGKLEEVLAVERELARVREDLERMEGRMRVLQDLVSLATITLNVHEIRRFEPAESPTLAGRIHRAWTQSWTGLRIASEALLVIVVASIPWLITPTVAITVLVLTLRRTRRPTA